MTFMDKVYTLRTEVRSDGETLYFISFTDGQGEFYDLEVSEPFFVEFRQMERKNRNLLAPTIQLAAPRSVRLVGRNTL